MIYNPQRHHRRSTRLKGYAYSQAGAYFVTCCVQDRACLFGDVMDGKMQLNTYGECVIRWWADISRRFPTVDVDEFVTMPNHVHGIIVINDRDITTPEGAETAPLQLRRPALGNVVAYFKYQSAKQINAIRETPSAPVWQRNYHDHIIRDEESLNCIRQYIVDNPTNWALDRENPATCSGYVSKESSNP